MTATPLRRCIVTGAVRPKAELIRFVVDPAGTIVPDPGNELPGRGIWCVPARDVLNTARQRRFARAARRPVSVPADLAERTRWLLTRRVADRLGLAARAGEAVAGFAKVRGWLEAGHAGVYLHARDAAVDGPERLRRLGRGVRPGLAVMNLLDSGELGAALGRGPMVHVAVADGGHARRLLADARRLAGLLDDDAWIETPTDTAAEHDDARR